MPKAILPSLLVFLAIFNYLAYSNPTALSFIIIEIVIGFMVLFSLKIIRSEACGHPPEFRVFFV